jgi:hypothetical protein
VAVVIGDNIWFVIFTPPIIPEVAEFTSTSHVVVVVLVSGSPRAELAIITAHGAVIIRVSIASTSPVRQSALVRDGAYVVHGLPYRHLGFVATWQRVVSFPEPVCS